MQPSPEVHGVLKLLKQHHFLSVDSYFQLIDALAERGHNPPARYAFDRKLTFFALSGWADRLQKSDWAKPILKADAVDGVPVWSPEKLRELERLFIQHERLVPNLPFYVPTKSPAREQFLTKILKDWRPILVAMTKLRPCILSHQEVNRLIQAACTELNKRIDAHRVSDEEFSRVDKKAYHTAIETGRVVFEAQRKLVVSASNAGRITTQEAKDRLKAVADKLHYSTCLPDKDYYVYNGMNELGYRNYYLYSPEKKTFYSQHEFRNHEQNLRMAQARSRVGW